MLAEKCMDDMAHMSNVWNEVVVFLDLQNMGMPTPRAS